MSRKFVCIISIAFLPLLGYAQSNVDIDFDDNGVVDLQDLLALTEAFGSNQARYDLHPDGVIDIKDLIIFASAYNQRDTSAVSITEKAEAREASAQVEFFELLTPNSRPNDLAIDPRGYIWFTEMGPNAIGRLEPPYRYDSPIFFDHAGRATTQHCPRQSGTRLVFRNCRQPHCPVGSLFR